MSHRTNWYIRNICRIGQRADCCRYLMIDGAGWDCARLPNNIQFSEQLDARADAGQMSARAIGCDGQSRDKLNAPYEPTECSGCGLSKARCVEAQGKGARACCPDCKHGSAA